MNPYSLSSLIASSACFFFAIPVILKGARNSQNRSFFLATVFTGIWTLFPFLTSLPKSDYNALLIARLLYIFAVFVPTAWFYFMISLLGKTEEKKKLIVFYIVSILFAAVSFTPLLVKDVRRFAPSFSPEPGPLYFPFMIFFAVIFTNIFFKLFIELKTVRGYRRSQLIYVTWAFIFGSISGIIHFVATYTNKEPIPHDLFIFIYPWILTYAILKHHLMDIKVVITRTGIFIAVYTILLGLPFAIAIRMKEMLVETWGINWWVLPAGLMAASATFGPFIYIYLQRKAEGRLLKEQRGYHEVLKQTAGGMTRIHNLQKLLDLVVDTVTEQVRISHSAIYLYDEQADEFILKAGCNLKKDQIHSISSKNVLIAWLQDHREPLVYEEARIDSEGDLDYASRELVTQMQSLNAEVIVPSFLENKLSNLIILGDKLSRKIYSSEDLGIFSILASHTAVAIENALLYGNMEEQVRQRTKELMEVQKQLIQVEKLATMGTLAGGVAHEINNPLTAILTNVQMLLASGGEIDAKLDRESLELIEEATKRCRTIVQKLMAYAKKPLEAAEISKVDLLNVIKNVTAFLGYQLEQENIKIISEAKGDGYLVTGNQNELEQVVTNIILNARDAIKQIKKSGDIRISFSKGDDWIKINIKDEGMGIAPEKISKIFDPFFTTKEVGKGTGLGLSICQAIIEKHNGMITVQSELNKGSTFTIKLPKVKVENKLKIEV